MNTAPALLPETWLASPPSNLVVGVGAYASALALILGGEFIRTEQILVGPGPNEVGGFPRVLGGLERVFLVASSSHSAADLLRIHDVVWDWVEKLSPDGDQQELSILFVVPSASCESLAIPLAAGLGLERFEVGTPGHGLIRMDSPLPALFAAVATVPSQDLPPLRAQQAANRRHALLKALIKATEDEVPAAARRVNEAFVGQEYLLDLFCRPPSHRNGNQLRGWLNAVVTEEVTPYNAARSDGSPSDWLDEGRFS
jgi:hypothetical protein